MREGSDLEGKFEELKKVDRPTRTKATGKVQC